MKILSITTSSKICGVAILEDTSIIKEINLNNGLTHSETLMPLIKQIFEETNLTLSDIDLLVSDIGPGSFTGIRIGISTVKAFADSLGIPSIGVNSLDSLTYNCGNIENLLLEIKEINPEYDITFVGDGATTYKNVILEYLPSAKFIDNNDLSASKVGFAGFYNYTTHNIQEAIPLYLRKSEAEKKLEEKLNGTK